MWKTSENVSWHHPSRPYGGGGNLMKPPEFFCGHVNFPEMNGGIIVYEGTESNNHEEGG